MVKRLSERQKSNNKKLQNAVRKTMFQGSLSKIQNQLSHSEAYKHIAQQQESKEK
jgi:negative regulator of sigma E activity